MCGIFGYIGKQQQAGNIILDGLKTLEYRGYDSWGVAIKKNDGSIYLEKHTGKIGQAQLPPVSSTIGIGHTRWATHGGVTDENAHPHTDCTENVVVVHNGIVENFAELKEELIAKGHTFKSQTDTEVAAHLIEELMKEEKDLFKLMLKVSQKIRGLSAIIAFFPEHETFYVTKNGSPIVFAKGKDELFIASDPSAIIVHTKNVYFMEDNEVLEINRNEYKAYDLDGKEKSITFTELSYDKEDAMLGDFPHFMLKEIHEQSKVLHSSIHTQVPAIKKCAEMVKKASESYFIGCGTASYACLAGTYLFSKIAHKKVNFASGSEFTYLLDFLNDSSLIMPLSQSGETIDIISIIKKAKNKGSNILSFTNVVGSTLYRLSDYNVLLGAGPEKAVASTKAYTTKVALLYLLAHELAGTLEKGVEYLEKAIQEIKHVLQHEEYIQQLAASIKDNQHMFVLGRGLSYAAALEASLKIKEVSYIHSEGFAAGELKHGVIALIEKGTPVIIFNPEDETYEDTLSSAYEVKARGARVIGISSKKDSVYDEFIEVKHCENATIIPHVVTAQLLAYYLAVLKGNDPDKPRNLAKSVTVK